MVNTDRELLQALFDFMKGRTYVVGEEMGIRDMVLRYKNPPLTLYRRAAMQMTVVEYNALVDLLKEIDEHLKPTERVELEQYANSPVLFGNPADRSPGNLSPDADAQQ